MIIISIFFISNLSLPQSKMKSIKNLSENTDLMTLFRKVENAYNRGWFEDDSMIFNNEVLHGFFEGLCLIVYKNILYLVGDNMDVLYQ